MGTCSKRGTTVNPEDAAAARHKEIRRAREETAKAEAALVEARSRLDELRGELPKAEFRDRERLGEALIANKSEPASEAEKVRMEIARQELRVEALQSVAAKARGQIPNLVERNRQAWSKQGRRELSRLQQRYLDAIGELEAAREALVDVATMISWLGSGNLGEATTGLAVDRMLAELRNDAERLAAHPDIPRGGPQPEPRFELATGASIIRGGWGGD
jgi:hypothetical protein